VACRVEARVDRKPAFAYGFGAAAFSRFASEGWWAHKGSNLGPLPCEGNALPLSYAPGRSKPGPMRAAIYEAAGTSVKGGLALLGSLSERSDRALGCLRSCRVPLSSRSRRRPDARTYDIISASCALFRPAAPRRAAGVTEDFGLAAPYADARVLRIVDGPDEASKPDRPARATQKQLNF
jgi:hypothetical protein